MKLYYEVLLILMRNEDARNHDHILTEKLWLEYHGSIVKKIDGNLVISNLSRVPPESTIRRYRAKIQNKEGLFLPTLEKVRKERRIREALWKKEMTA